MQPNPILERAMRTAHNANAPWDGEIFLPEYLYVPIGYRVFAPCLTAMVLRGEADAAESERQQRMHRDDLPGWCMRDPPRHWSQQPVTYEGR